MIILLILLLLHVTLQASQPEQEIYNAFQNIIQQLKQNAAAADENNYIAYHTFRYYNPKATSWDDFQNLIKFYEKPTNYDSVVIENNKNAIDNLRTTPTQNRGNKDYYEFTNFWQEDITIDGEKWPAVENYFQAQKLKEFILNSITEWPQTISIPQNVHTKKNFQKTFQNKNEVIDYIKTYFPSRVFQVTKAFQKITQADLKQWHQTKNSIMIKAIWTKFSQNQQLKDLLIKTGSKILVENAGNNDKEWGAGADLKGNNFLGITLMLIREKLNNQKPDGTLKNFNDITTANYLVKTLSAKNNGQLIQQLNLNVSKMDYSKTLNTENFNTIFPAESFTQQVTIKNETYNGVEFYLQRTYSDCYSKSNAKKEYNLFLWQMRLEILLTVNQTIKQNLLKSENKTILFTNNNNLNDDFFGVNNNTKIGFNHVGQIAMALRKQLLESDKKDKESSIPTQLVTPVTKTKIKNENPNTHPTLTRTPQAEFPPKSTPTIKHNSFIKWLLGFDFLKGILSWFGYT